MALKDYNTVEAAEKGFVYEVTYPLGPQKGEVMGPKIKVAGVGSKEYKAGNDKITAYVTEQYRRGKTPDQKIQDQLNLELVVGCIRDWSNMQEEEGVDIPFSKSEAMRLCEAYPWLVLQLVNAISDLESMLEEK